jgi:uncharacterized LabA/DUF88 family protein
LVRWHVLVPVDLLNRKGVRMNPQLYIYVDGESHFIRSEECWKWLHGDQAQLESVVAECHGVAWLLYPMELPRIRIERKASFFWDTQFITNFLDRTQRPTVARAVYFTSMTAGQDLIHEAQVAIRSHGFEPQVISELKKLSDQRANLLNTEGVIEKAKGVDIGLAVRMLEDAYMNNYQECLLFTSDVDYLPAIRAVRRMGKAVAVLGYRKGLSKMSNLEFEPDAFVDLEEIMKRQYRLQAPSH